MPSRTRSPHPTCSTIAIARSPESAASIKSVQKDVLTQEIASSDSDLRIKWEKIASIESDRWFLVETIEDHCGRRREHKIDGCLGRAAVRNDSGWSKPFGFTF
jgi:hypothetical protein